MLCSGELNGTCKTRCNCYSKNVRSLSWPNMESILELQNTTKYYPKAKRYRDLVA